MSGSNPSNPGKSPERVAKFATDSPGPTGPARETPAGVRLSSVGGRLVVHRRQCLAHNARRKRPAGEAEQQR